MIDKYVIEHVDDLQVLASKFKTLKIQIFKLVQVATIIANLHPLWKNFINKTHVL